MNKDALSASWVLVVGTIFIAYWYYSKKGGVSPASKVAPAGGAHNLPGKGPLLTQLEALADQFGLKVTSTTGGQHNVGSPHFLGRAIDVSVRGVTQGVINAFKRAATAAGFLVRDERTRPAGQEVWGGPHLHLEAPIQRSDVPMDPEFQLAKDTS